MLQLEKQIQVANKVNNTANKENVINKTLNKYLCQPVNYTLLAELHGLHLIILPNYKLVLVKYKKQEPFQKEIHKMVNTLKQNTFIDSVITRRNGQLISYSLAVINLK